MKPSAAHRKPVEFSEAMPSADLTEDSTPDSTPVESSSARSFRHSGRHGPSPNRHFRSLRGTTVALLGLLCWGVTGCHSQEREAWPPEQANRAAPSAVSVTVAPVVRRPVQRTVDAVGTLWGFEEVIISTKVQGVVRSILHDVSDRVAPNEVLLEIDPTDYELAVRQAEKSLAVELAKLGLREPPGATVDVTQFPPVVQASVRLKNAQSKLQRAQLLREKNVTTVEELADRTTDAQVAQAEYDNQVLLAQAGVATIRVEEEDLAVARQQLRDTVIRAPTPTAGSVLASSSDAATADSPVTAPQLKYAITKRSVSEGSLVRSGTEVFSLVLDHTLKLKAAIPERYSGDVQLGQAAEVRTAAFRQPFQGSVRRINPAVDPETRTFEVEIQVANPRNELKPGSFAKVSIITRTDPEATTVPLESLVTFAGVTKIFLFDEGQAKEVPVELGSQSTEWVEVSQPELPQGAQVVTSGHTNLADGTPLTIRQPAEKPDVKPAEKQAVKSTEKSTAKPDVAAGPKYMSAPQELPQENSQKNSRQAAPAPNAHS